MDLCFTLLLIAGLSALIIKLLDSKKKERARLAYTTSLQSLKQDPNNPDLREKTLQLGRVYSNLMKDISGRTTFDEVALMNDINAACARATVGQNDVGKVQVTNVAAVNGQSVAQEIEKLGGLFLAGVITAEEFERGKTLFLGAPSDKAATAVALLQNLDGLRKQGVLSPSEFNMKKWEILSERLIPGRMQAARFTAESSGGPAASALPQKIYKCPVCKGRVPAVSSGSPVTCPSCGQKMRIR